VPRSRAEVAQLTRVQRRLRSLRSTRSLRALPAGCPLTDQALPVPPDPPAELDPRAILAALERHGVRFVLVGREGGSASAQA
jgi:hypothetical protein